jgi:hypothetical protein
MASHSYKMFIAHANTMPLAFDRRRFWCQMEVVDRGVPFGDKLAAGLLILLSQNTIGW